ncbi:MAG: HEAT repeat domain-containing protein [Gemmatimonadota bacterium]
MKDPVSYARALATLTWQVQEKAALLSLRDSLRVIGAHSRAGDTEFACDGTALSVDGAHVPGNDVGCGPLLDAMRAHRLHRILIDDNVSPKELLLLATLLAGSAADTERSVVRLADELGLWHVRLEGATPEPITDDVRASCDEADPASFTTPESAREQAAALVQRAHDAADAGAAAEVVGALQWLMSAESVAEPAVAAVWAETFDRLGTLPLLRYVALRLCDDRADRAPLVRILQRAGDAGASAAVAHMIAAPTLRERRMLFDTIRELRHGVAVLLRSLQHPQWFVVRNAAALLGEMRVPEAMPGLTALLSHKDVRVRSAAVTAIAALDTSDSRATLQLAMRDGSSEVRRQAFYAMFARAEPIDDGALADAIEAESNVNTQLDMIDVLVRSTAPDALRKLTRVCAFAANTATDPLLRIAAMTALSKAKPSAALPYLRRLSEDRDSTVRDRARGLLAATAGAATAGAATVSSGPTPVATAPLP